MNGRFGMLAQILRSPQVGCLVFGFGIVVKNLVLFFGGGDQRAAEYPWILRQLVFLRKGSTVLDVGCSESILSHVLVMRGFRVVGLDLRDAPFKSRYMSFVKRNVIDSGLPEVPRRLPM
jgi:2-polyprenyl-3-methyl-5-hydroxy-6-metoxy-1,4-benzoquinol methylase